MLKKLTITGCTLLLLAGCGTNTANMDMTNQPNTTNGRNASNFTNINNEPGLIESNFNITNPAVSLSEAVKTFNEAFPDAKIESIDLEIGFGRLYYDIDGFDSMKEYEVKIDATTKELNVYEVETKKYTDAVLNLSDILEPAQAIDIASQISEVQGLTPIGWSLEAEYGMQIYTVEYRDNYTEIEVTLNALTGEILEVEWDD